MASYTKNNELISRVYYAQKKKPIKNDWSLQVDKDAQDIGLKIDIQEIKKMKKSNFKKQIKTKIQALALKQLNKIKKSHSKVLQLKYTKLETQNYIKKKIFSTKEITTLFKLRTRMVQVKMNFKNFYDNTLCDLCYDEEDSQEHMLNCEKLIEHCDELYNDYIVNYEDIYSSDPHVLLRVTKLFMKVIESKENLIEGDNV